MQAKGSKARGCAQCSCTSTRPSQWTTWGARALAGTSLLAASCSSHDVALLEPLEARAVTGSAQVALAVGDLDVGSVRAELYRKGLETQRQRIELPGDGTEGSVLFADLPVGTGYTLILRAGACSGSAVFAVEANATTEVGVKLKCAAGTKAGGALVSATFEATAAPVSCDLVSSIVAAPSLQIGEDRETSVQLVLLGGVSETRVEWTVSAPSGARGVLYASDESDLAVAFDCATDGELEVVATITALQDGRSCSDEARAFIACLDQPSTVLPKPEKPSPPAP